MVTDPLFYALAIPAIVITGVSKGGLGGGLGIMAVPVMALAVGPVQAAAILLPILCVMDLFGLKFYFGVWSRPNMMALVPGALLGLLIGGLSFRYLDAASIQLLIGTVAVLFVVYHYMPKPHGQQPTGARPLRGTFWGVVSGFTSFIAHAGGPPAAMHLLPQRMDKTVFLGTTVVFFTMLNYVKLGPYWYLGQFEPGNLLTSAILMPLAPLGMWLGYRLHHLLSEGWFYTACYSLLFITGLKLMYDGVVALF